MGIPTLKLSHDDIEKRIDRVNKEKVAIAKLLRTLSLNSEGVSKRLESVNNEVEALINLGAQNIFLKFRDDSTKLRQFSKVTMDWAIDILEEINNYERYRNN